MLCVETELSDCKMKGFVVLYGSVCELCELFFVICISFLSGTQTLKGIVHQQRNH